MISWSQWHSIHFAAASLKKRYPKLSWIAHLSDPWADNPFIPKFPYFSFIQKYLEKSVIKHSDQIHFTTEETLSLVMKKYPASFLKRALVIPHSFDSSLYNIHEENMTDSKGQIKVVRYLGNFYGPRNPEKFLQALALTANASPEIVKDIRFEFIGRWIGANSAVISKFELPKELVVFRDPVSLSLIHI